MAATVICMSGTCSGVPFTSAAMGGWIEGPRPLLVASDSRLMQSVSMLRGDVANVETQQA